MIILEARNRTISTPAGEKLLSYRLLGTDSVRAPMEYGASILDLSTGEEASLPNLTTRRERADLFLSRLIRGGATPVSLVELAEDFVAEC